MSVMCAPRRSRVLRDTPARHAIGKLGPNSVFSNEFISMVIWRRCKSRHGRGASGRLLFYSGEAVPSLSPLNSAGMAQWCSMLLPGFQVVHFAHYVDLDSSPALSLIMLTCIIILRAMLHSHFIFPSVLTAWFRALRDIQSL